MLKKFLIIGTLFLLMSCESDTTKISETPEVLNDVEVIESLDVNTDGIWYDGEVIGLEFSLQYSVFEEKVIGQYKMGNSDSILLRGSISGDLVRLDDDTGNRFVFLNHEEKIFGAWIKDDQVTSFYVSKNQSKIPSHVILTEKTNQLSGLYSSLRSTVYEGSQIKVIPLFEHLLYVEMCAYNGLESFEYDFILENNALNWLSKDGKYPLELVWDHHEILVDDMALPRTPDNLSWDKGYVSSYKPLEGDALSLGLVDTQQEMLFLEALLQEDYEKLIAVSQYVEEDNDSVKLIKVNGSMERGKLLKVGPVFYVELFGFLYDDQKSRLYTNAIHLDETIIKEHFTGKPIVISKVLLENLYETKVEQSHVDDFIPDAYVLKDQANGDLNGDGLEDLVLVLDHKEDPSTRNLIVLKNLGKGYAVESISDRVMYGSTEGGIWGDPYDQISIKDHKLLVSFYGGSQERWAESYVYDGLLDFRLVQYTTLNYNTSDLIIDEWAYDFLNNKVVHTVENGDQVSKTEFKKTLKERIYLSTFDIHGGIDVTYQ